MNRRQPGRLAQRQPACVLRRRDEGRRGAASWKRRELTDPATTGRSPRAPSRGRGERLNDRFPAPSLGSSSTWPGHIRSLAI